MRTFDLPIKFQSETHVHSSLFSLVFSVVGCGEGLESCSACQQRDQSAKSSCIQMFDIASVSLGIEPCQTASSAGPETVKRERKTPIRLDRYPIQSQ